MKAIMATEFGGPDVLKYLDVDVPTIQKDEVLISVEGTSVNFADIKARKGNKGKGNLPFIPGIDVAGVVEKVGSNVDTVKEGQRVIAFPKQGSYAEYAVANQNLTFRIPDQLDIETAIACPIVSFTSYQLLHDVARIESGETVLIHAAAGGIGTTAIQLAKLLGAGKVIGTVGSEVKIPVALEAGADHVISHDHEDFAQKVNELTNGEGANVILDSIAGWVSEKSVACLAPYGRLVHFGNASGEVGHFQTKDLHASCRSVLGFSFGTTRKKRPHLIRPVAEKVIPYLANGQLKINVGRSFSLAEAKEAQEWVESRQSTGKVILKVRND
ncbi:quinone oxidoreductase family protein [Salinibacillus xinjiangensis]|uniref:Zinc-binding dehydrogenase n=1 Tax=Salinibacillus xinjiangensis TaxID=1229268 RepID=A0A6G1X6I3_9BACI|nr:zinc-binding dehydrogenase [Salinibacillus xinjiangensis]MRG86490.1 zinc-binding dehydrogenase [Salinibacillus xinjiangensis]